MTMMQNKNNGDIKCCLCGSFTLPCYCTKIDAYPTVEQGMKRAKKLAETAMNKIAEDSFNVGDKVMKVGGDYKFDGVIVATFYKLSGAPRYVVEDDRGVLHIYSFKNLSLRP